MSNILRALVSMFVPLAIASGCAATGPDEGTPSPVPDVGPGVEPLRDAKPRELCKAKCYSDRDACIKVCGFYGSGTFGRLCESGCAEQTEQCTGVCPLY